MSREGCVGVFDSGVGGISVLKSLAAELPHEDFVFFGDSANAPYGEKTEDEVLELSRANVERLLADGAKAIVIACNTATSVAAETLRGEYPDLPIVGVEPALKPATLAPKHDRILVMATPITLKLD
ncbi:MAG: glutamate racemase, partial [Parafannyhessea sp.]|uniref:glutamate racemase n=1 Tax=Parafannyhessea sp. TaxID=2847324 RepID=UPI003F0000BF